MIEQELTPLLRSNEEPDLRRMKEKVETFLSDLMKYDEAEQQFLRLFLDGGIYEPELLFRDSEQAQRLRDHPAVLWKLHHHRQYFGLGQNCSDKIRSQVHANEKKRNLSRPGKDKPSPQF